MMDMKEIPGMTPRISVKDPESKPEVRSETAAAVRNSESPTPAAESAKPGGSNQTTSNQSGSSAPNEKADDQWPRPQPLSDKEKRACKEKRQPRTWLMDDPQGWVGRRVKCRRNMAVYTVSQVYKNGRVSLERNWMSYFSDVETVRKDYDTYC